MDKLYKVVILPEAQEDIRGITLYIARKLHAPDAALNLAATFQKSIQSLAIRPKRIKTIDEEPWNEIGIRKTKAKNYYIYFIVDDDDVTVYINAVIYIKRDQRKQLIEKRIGRM